MGSIHCLCGRDFTDGAIPCPHLYTVIPDTGLEELVNKLLSNALF